MWGYGVTLWEMYSFGDQPYDDMTGSEVLCFRLICHSVYLNAEHCRVITDVCLLAAGTSYYFTNLLCFCTVCSVTKMAFAL